MEKENKEEIEIEEVNLDKQENINPSSTPNEEIPTYVDFTKNSSPAPIYPKEAIKSKIRREKLKEKLNPESTEDLRKPTKEEKIQARDNFNKDPNTKNFGFFAIKKTTYVMMWITIGLLILIIALGTFWFNATFMEKDFGTNLTVNSPVNVNPSDVNVNNYDNHTINVQNNITLVLPGELSINLNHTNST